MLHRETAGRVSAGAQSVAQWRDEVIGSAHQFFSDPVQVVLYAVFGFLLVATAVASAISPKPALVVLLVGGLILAGAAISRPSLAVLLVFGGAGLAATQIPLPGHQARLLEPALALCMAAIVLRRSHTRLGTAHVFALLFAAIAVISFIHAPEFVTDVNTPGANKDLYDYLLVVLAFWCGTFLAEWIRDASSFLVLVLLANIPPYVVGLSQILNIKIPPPLKIEFYPTRILAQSQGRVFGPFPGAATFGMYLINLFAIAVSCWLIGSTRRHRVLGAIMTLVTALFVIASGTRSALIAVGIILVMGAILTRRYKLVVSTVIVAGLAVLPYINKVLEQFAHPDASETDRLFLWQQALTLISGHPWIGIGLEGFTKYYQTLNVSRQLRLDPTGVSVHNQYLEIAMQSGVPWLIITILWLVAVLVLCWRAYPVAPRPQQTLLLAAILALLGNMGASFVDVPLEHVEGAVFLMLLAGLGLSYADQVQQARRRGGGAPPSAVPPFVLPRLSSRGPQNGHVAISATGVGHGLYQPARIRLHPTNGIRSGVAEVQPQAGQATGSVPHAVNERGASRTIAIRLFTWGIAIPITFPANVLLARYLGPTRFGEYSFTFSFLLVFSLVSSLGLDAIIIRQLTHQERHQWPDILSFAAGTRLVSTVVTAVLASIVALVMPITMEQRILLLLAGPLLLFTYRPFSFRTFFEDGFRAEQRVSIPSLIETSDRVVTAGLVVLIILGHLSLVWAFILITYSDLPFFLILTWVSRRRFGMTVHFSLARAREHVRSGMPLLGYSLLSLIGTQFDVFLLMWLAGSTSVGIYALALRLTDPLLTVITTYVTGLYPLLCAKTQETRGALAVVYRNGARIMALSIVPIAIFVVVDSHQIVVLLGGLRFAGAAIALQLLMVVAVLTSFNRLATYTCMAVRLDRSIPVVTSVTATVNLLANVVLIPHWQVVGAGVASVMSESAEFTVLSLLLFRHAGLLPPFAPTVRVLLGNLPALIFLVWKHDASMWRTLPVAAVMVIVGCMATGAFSLRDVAIARDMFLAKRTAVQSHVAG